MSQISLQFQDTIPERTRTVISEMDRLFGKYRGTTLALSSEAYTSFVQWQDQFCPYLRFGDSRHYRDFIIVEWPKLPGITVCGIADAPRYEVKP